MKTKLNLSLERLLTVWRDRAFFTEMEKKWDDRNPSSTLGVPFDKFDDHLMSLPANGIDGEDDTFWTKSWKEAVSDECRFQGGTAYALTRWVANSRRIFRIEDDLRMLLDATSLEDLKLSDVGFPFDAFAIETETPFIGATGIPIDTFICSIEREEEHCTIHIFAIKKRVEKYKPLPIQTKTEIRQALAKPNPNWSKIGGMLNKCERHTANVPVETFHSKKWPLDIEIDDAIEEMREDLGDEFSQILMGNGMNSSTVIDTFAGLLRMTFGMCLYLKSLPAGSSQVSDWEAVPRQKDARIKPTDDALVCRVESTFKLAPNERKIFEASANEMHRSFGEKCCHFRRGTWCRPKNSAPDAKRSEWRRPTIVRADRLGPGEIPKGARTILLDKK